MRILFVCLGNICRSPTAESVFKAKAEDLGLTDMFFDSAGTAAYHIGERSDPRSIAHAEARKYQMTHLARQINQNDFNEFDLILVMDYSNLTNVLKIAPEDKKHLIKLATDYCLNEKYDHLPDPYYGSKKDFENVIDILEDAAEGFFKSIT